MNIGDHRCTPKSVTDAVRDWREIGCDPCWNPGAAFRPRIVYDGAELGDGLSMPWNDREREVTWVNGPWSNLYPWAERATFSWEVLFWGPCYTETAWAKLLYDHAFVVCFWGNRVHHPYPPEIEKEMNEKRAAEGKPPMGKSSQWPTQMIYRGEHVDSFCDHFRDYGTCMRID